MLDDYRHIVSNESIRDLGQPARILLTGYRPIVNLTLALNYAIGGDSPRGYHVANVAIHLLAGMTLFGIIRQTLLLRRFGEQYRESAPWLALIVALLWTVHPLQTQSVTYVIQRGESLMGLFYLLTLYCVIRGATAAEPGRRPMMWYGAAVLASVLGLGCKAVIVTAPAVVLLYDWRLLSGSLRDTLRKRWGLYAGLVAGWGLLGVTGLLRGVFFAEPGASVAMGFGYQGVTPTEYLLTQAGVLVHYIRLAFVPYPQCLDYNWPVARSAAAIVIPGIIVVALLIGSIWAVARKHWAGVAGAWFFIILAPTSSFIPIKDIAFEHRMYLPLAAVIVVVLGAARWLLNRLVERGTLTAPRRGAIQVVIVIGLVGLLSGLTVARNLDYHSEVGMWRQVLAQRPDNARAWTNLGLALSRSSRTDEALEAWRRASEIDPESSAPHVNRGKALIKLERFSAAVSALEAAVDAGATDAHVFGDLAAAYWRTGQRNESLAAYERAIAAAPARPRYRRLLAEKLVQLGRSDGAIYQYQAALRIEELDAAQLAAAGQAALRQEQPEAAVAALRLALEQNPRLVQAHYDLGITLCVLRRGDEGRAEFERVLELDPDHQEARQALRKLAESPAQPKATP